jgi:hypothetical protein
MDAVLSFTDSSVTNGVTYYYAVKAVNVIGEGPSSSEVSCTPMTLPSAPIHAYADASDGALTLYWTAPSSNGGSAITGYAIYRGESLGMETLLLIVGNVNTYVDGSVTNGVEYYYQISAINSVGEGPKSNEFAAVPEPNLGEPSSMIDISGASWVDMAVDSLGRIHVVTLLARASDMLITCWILDYPNHRFWEWGIYRDRFSRPCTHFVLDWDRIILLWPIWQPSNNYGPDGNIHLDRNRYEQQPAHRIYRGLSNQWCIVLYRLLHGNMDP